MFQGVLLLSPHRNSNREREINHGETTNTPRRIGDTHRFIAG